MGRILTDVLQGLRRIYRVPGQLKAPQDIELSLPIQVVHDVSRQADFGRALVGSDSGSVSASFPYFTVNFDHFHTDINILRTGIGIYSNQPTNWALGTWIPPDPKEENVWIIDAWVQVDQPGGLDQAYITSSQDPKAGAGSGFAPHRLIHFVDAQLDTADALGQIPAISTAGPNPMLLPNPILISNKLLNNTPLTFISLSLITCEMDAFLLCLRLPIGVFPPGLG